MNKVLSVFCSYVINMALRQICKKTAKHPLKSLFFFPGENMTGIAPTKLIVEKDLELREGLEVQVNWQGKKVRAKILALNGKSPIA